MVLYGLGFAAIYLLMAALYGNAWRQRDELGLNDLERLQTRLWVVEPFEVGGIGLLSCVVALMLPPQMARLAGFVYMLIGVFKTWHGAVAGRRVRRVLAEQTTAHDIPAT